MGPSVTFESLTKFYEGRTALEAEKLLKPYIGKWMTFSGVVREIKSAHNDRLVVSFRDELRFLLAYFEKSWADHISILSRGAQISIRGKIEDVDRDSITLYERELAGSDA